MRTERLRFRGTITRATYRPFVQGRQGASYEVALTQFDVPFAIPFERFAAPPYAVLHLRVKTTGQLTLGESVEGEIEVRYEPLPPDQPLSSPVPETGEPR